MTLQKRRRSMTLVRPHRCATLHRLRNVRPKGGPMADRRGLATEARSPEDVYRMLRTRIMTCELVPGQLLTERASAVRFGVGLSPLRDALTRLVSDGLVQAVPPNAYRITPLDLK